MRKLLMTGIACLVTGALAYTPALPQEAKDAKPAAAGSTKHASYSGGGSRTALCRADCMPNNLKPSGLGIHGRYRAYNDFDPHLTSIEGKKQFAECVRNCLNPLPRIYVQRPILEAGGTWFGKDAASCMACHAKGPNLVVSSKSKSKKK